MQPTQIVAALIALTAAIGFLAMPNTRAMVSGDAEGAASDSTQSDVTDLIAGNGRIPSLSDDPMIYRHTSQRGYRVERSGIVGLNDQVFHTAKVLAGIPPEAERIGAMPVDAYSLPAPADCQFRAPLVGERIVNVNTEGTSGPETAVQAFDDATLATQTAGWIEATLNSGNPETAPLDRHLVSATLRELNLVLTDTTAPLYLVLQSMGGQILWNIHPAEGVTIAHIAVIGGGPVAVSPPPGDYDVEILNARTSECGVVPVKIPRAHWGFLSDGNGNINQDELSKANDSYRQYNAWFAPRFRIEASQNEIGVTSQNYLLFGPVPFDDAARPNYRPISDATVLVSDEPYLLNAPKPDRDAFVAGLEMELAKQAAGGDLAMMIPAPQERMQ